MKQIIDYSIYLVTDHHCLQGREFFRCLEAALQGGITLMQLREKDADGGIFLQRALAVKKLCDKYNVPLLINDRIDIALACKAAGVHLGQNDIPPAIARNILGADAIIGVSAHNCEEALSAECAGADYLGIGAVFPTNSKDDASEIGLSMLKNIRKITGLPIVGIGGINAYNYEAVRKAGAQGAAIISGILSAENIEDEVRKIKRTISD
ncbi:MAG: thiamine phosphate synthase [Acidaminococcaceae bacterium]